MPTQFIRLETGQTKKENSSTSLSSIEPPKEWRTPPEEVELLLTQGCNLRCVHCCVDAAHARPEELSTKEWIDLINQLADYGVIRVALSGGEPLLRNDFFAIAEHATSRGLTCPITTNGWFIDEEKAARIANLHTTCNISLDGPKDIHDTFRAVPGAYDRAIKAMRNLKKFDAPFTISFAATSKTIQYFSHVYDVAHNEGARAVGIAILHTVGRGADLSLMPKWDDWQKLVLELTDKRKNGAFKIPVTPIFDGGWPLCLPLRERLEDVSDPDIWSWPALPSRYQTCPAAVYHCAIGSDGIVYPCDLVTSNPRLGAGSVRNHSFVEIWERSAMMNYWRGFKLPYPCTDCDMNHVCHSGCRASAFFVTGNLDAPDPRCPIVQEKVQIGNYMRDPEEYLPEPGEMIASENIKVKSDPNIRIEFLTIFGKKFRFVIRSNEVDVATFGASSIHINHSGYEILKMVSSGELFKEVVGHLQKKYSIDRTTAERDISQLLITLKQYHLLSAIATLDYIRGL